MDLVARKTRQRPGDHDRFPRQCRPGRCGDELWSDAEAFHLLDTVAVGGNRKIKCDRFRDFRADLSHLEQLIGRRVHQRVDRVKMIGKQFRRALAQWDHAPSEIAHSLVEAKC